MAEEALAKGSHYYFRPSDLVLVQNPAHELFDARASDPPDPDLMASLAAFGNRTAVKVVRAKSYVDEHGNERENVLLVAAGRRRVAAAQAVEAQQEKAGEPTIRLKCEYAKGSSAEEMAIENTHRKAENPAELARKAARFSNMGYTPKQIATLFGVDSLTVRNWLDLSAANPEIVKAVADGTVSANVARELTKAPAAAAEAVIKETRAKGRKLKGAQGKAAAKKAKAQKETSSDIDARLGVQGIRKMLEAFTPGEAEKDEDDTVCDVVRCTLEFILGLDPSAKGLAQYKDSAAAKLARKIRSETVR